MLTSLFSRQRGFTMVELLVVISIIGILATAVLAALNPIEQLRKARDTSRKADATTILGALDRFQATFGCYPWAWNGTACTVNSEPVTGQGYTTALTSGGSGMAINAAAFGATGSLYQLLQKDELKSQFSSRSTVAGSEMWVSVSGTKQVSVCFEPESQTARGQGLGPIRTARNLTGEGANNAACTGTYSDPITAGTDLCAVCVPQ